VETIKASKPKRGLTLGEFWILEKRKGEKKLERKETKESFRAI